LGVGVFLWTQNKNDVETQRTVVHSPANEVMPAMGKVVLQFPDGQQIYLDSMQGSIVKEGALTVDNKKGAVVYNGVADKMEYHTLTVPRGRQYQLQLPDGTNVWLNAASSITYPIVFTGPERKVTISGEVYFEVAKNKSKPFRVAANDMMITVTGTHFNVNAYSDQPFLTTTLLEGGVKVFSNNKTVILSPNEQALSDATGSMSVNRNVNVHEIMAWKEGFFHFESADLPTILRELARWYDVEVAYEGAISKERFFVIVNRKSSLSAVLKALQANDVAFNINGKKLTVKSNK
jgi:transmembrane sensor